MQPIFFLLLLLRVVETSNVTVLLIGSRHKSTEDRVIARAKQILADCEQKKISCSVYDALNGLSSDSQGLWAITPAIVKLPEVSDWTIVAEDTSEINLKLIESFTSTESASDFVFSGFGLQDKEPTIIHHFGMNAPQGFRYPLLSAGFILSKRVVEAVQKLDQIEKGFAIDAKYEFALLLHKRINIPLEHEPNFFCCGKSSETCIVQCSATPSSTGSLENSDIHVMIKTFSGHHQGRLSVLMNTWTNELARLEYCSDEEEPTIPTVNLGVGNAERGHCAKTWAIFRRFLDVSGAGAKWLVVADDDTLMSWRRLKQMLEMYDSDDTIIIGERYGFGFSIDGQSGYDYPTGGSGMIFSRSAVESILRVCPSCAADTDPDDMTIGICAISSDVPIVHEPRLHQARPQDYAPEYIRDPISFHKFTDVDPIFVYYKYLSDFDDLVEHENTLLRSEL